MKLGTVMEDTSRSQQSALSDPTPRVEPSEGRDGDPTLTLSEPDPPLAAEGVGASTSPSFPKVERQAWPLQLTLKVALVCIAAYVVPGAGHALLGRWGRALLLFLAIMGMFTAGLFLFGGRLYTFNPEEPLSIFPLIANLGLGSIYALCALTRAGLEARPELTTYEYGNAFLLVAGLLNYLAVLDAFDIAIGRKK